MKKTKPTELGMPAPANSGSWVQTDRKAHEAWAHLISRKPRAAELLHHLVAQMGQQNAVVVSQKVLAQLMGKSLDTVQRALRVLEEEKWIQVVKMNGPGTVAAYVVNDRVAWGQKRDQLYLSAFSATVIADRADQDALALEGTDLKRIPVLYPGERQLPTGPGEDPPSQPSIPDMEPDLPSIRKRKADDQTARQELEKQGQQRLTD
jgi:DNA-binding transcriptional MocR family regulator